MDRTRLRAVLAVCALAVTLLVTPLATGQTMPTMARVSRERT